MKRLILTIMLVTALLVPVASQAFTFEENCGDAIRFNWNCSSCNASCLFKLMADISGPGPDGMW